MPVPEPSVPVARDALHELAGHLAAVLLGTGLLRDDDRLPSALAGDVARLEHEARAASRLLLELQQRPPPGGGEAGPDRGG